ncbi:hypothetical protein MX659_04110 [Coriobacteriia bacterium Es71-Z0120]|uniref:hypothetical protein n=1 Tax=Parvivirga hydrogeniphila TaxID=2939460 RepID=UPI002260ECDD|nr:hypothetical protein [Parvivirga hydrogeniphila]MCL4078783.1 hypothetical protein [Parvivirga hydrogeniphila]
MSAAPLRIGMVGYGYWGPNIVRNLARLASAELVALCDASEKNRARFEAAYPGVTRDVPPKTVVMGVPARAVRSVPDEELLENQ